MCVRVFVCRITFMKNCCFKDPTTQEACDWFMSFRPANTSQLTSQLSLDWLLHHCEWSCSAGVLYREPMEVLNFCPDMNSVSIFMSLWRYRQPMSDSSFRCVCVGGAVQVESQAVCVKTLQVVSRLCCQLTQHFTQSMTELPLWNRKNSFP